MTDRIPSPVITARQLAKAADGINTALQEITRSIRDLQGSLNPSDSDPSLILLKDRSERMETNIATLQQTVNLVVDKVNDPRTREKEFLGSLLAVTLDVGDTLETVKEAIVGLTQQVQTDHQTTGCAWRAYLAKTDLASGAVIFSDLARISSMADRLEIMVKEDLAAKGFDPETGKRREWFHIQVDKVRLAFDNMLINLLLGVLVGAGVYTYHYLSEHSQVIQMQTEFELERMNHQKEKDVLLKTNQDLQSQLFTAKALRSR